MLQVNIDIRKCNTSWFYVENFLFFFMSAKSFVFISWMYSCSQTRSNRNVSFQIYCMNLMRTVFCPCEHLHFSEVLEVCVCEIDRESEYRCVFVLCGD